MKKTDRIHQENTLPGSRHGAVLWGAFIIVAILCVYWPVGSYDFVDVDDDLYVFNNRYVQSGLTVEGIKWAFGMTGIAHWHPLTWISLMMDAHIFGPAPAGFHLTNLLFHIISSILIFLIFKQATGSLLRSGFLAMLFAIHPLNVESVVWIAERKNVLSVLFLLLTLLAYLRYTKKRSGLRYLLLFIPFSLGLLAKSTVAVLPFILLAFDIWPLKRISLKGPSLLSKTVVSTFRRMLTEKLPMLFLSFGAVYMASLSLQHHGKVIVTDTVPVFLRISCAITLPLKYLVKTLCPTKLAVFYPYPDTVSFWAVFFSLLWIILVTLLSIRFREKYPFLIAGWFWYASALAPYFGLVQAGLWPEMADRWAYVPSIGIFIIMVWGVADLTKKWRIHNLYLKALAVLLTVLMITIARIQVGYWSDSISLFRHTVDVTENNYMAHLNLGFAVEEIGDKNQAIRHYHRALAIHPKFELAHLNLGVIFASMNRYKSAEKHFHRAISIDPRMIKAFGNLGNLYLRQGRIDEAVTAYSNALRIDSDDGAALNGLGAAMVKKGNLRKAAFFFKQAIASDPHKPFYRKNLENTLTALSKRQQE